MRAQFLCRHVQFIKREADVQHGGPGAVAMLAVAVHRLQQFEEVWPGQNRTGFSSAQRKKVWFSDGRKTAQFSNSEEKRFSAAGSTAGTSAVFKTLPMAAWVRREEDEELSVMVSVGEKESWQALSHPH